MVVFRQLLYSFPCLLPRTASAGTWCTYKLATHMQACTTQGNAHTKAMQQQQHTRRVQCSHAKPLPWLPRSTPATARPHNPNRALPPVPCRAAPRRLPARLALLPSTTHVARVVNDAIASAPPPLPRTCPHRCPFHDATARAARHLAVPPSPSITELLRARLCQPPADCLPPRLRPIKG
jgi:hypothetical protein